MTDPKINSILDEGNRLFLQGKFEQAIDIYKLEMDTFIELNSKSDYF